jgi:hypothetical protein
LRHALARTKKAAPDQAAARTSKAGICRIFSAPRLFARFCGAGTIFPLIGSEFNAPLAWPGGKLDGNFQPKSNVDTAYIFFLPKKTACRVAAPVYENHSRLKMRQAEREASDAER